MEVSPESSRIEEPGDNEVDISAGDLKLGVTPLPVDTEEMFDPENKENANPRLILNRRSDPEKIKKDGGGESSDHQGWLRQREDKGKEKACFQGRNLRAIFHNVPAEQPSFTPEKMEIDEGADGFEIGEDLQLDAIEDDASTSGGAVDGDRKRKSNGGQVSDDESSPMITSLVSNRVTFLAGSTERRLNLVSNSAENGASPLFQQSNGERRLGFGSVLTQSGANTKSSGGSGARSFRRCVSMMERRTPPPQDSSPPHQMGSRAMLDFTSPVSRHQQMHSGFKRPIDPCNSSESQDELSAIQSFSQHRSKRQRGPHDGHPMRSCSTPVIGEAKSLGAKMLSRSKSLIDSAAAERIMQACSLADDQTNLTGDTRYKLALPTVKGQAKNHDLKNIDCHTLANVIKGKYSEKVAKYRILDARYCYEYEGGHIRGAENFGAWDEEAFLKEFFPSTMTVKQFPMKSHTAPEQEDNEKREIIVFHCEFSSARGPALMRKLRNKDRDMNKTTYPALHYPECYLLHEGYKVFYENYPELCDPQSYLPMNHPSYTQEERKFHKKSKSWAAGGGGGTIARTGASSRLLKL